jgi:hypothetical protein
MSQGHHGGQQMPVSPRRRRACSSTRCALVIGLALWRSPLTRVKSIHSREMVRHTGPPHDFTEGRRSETLCLSDGAQSDQRHRCRPHVHPNHVWISLERSRIRASRRSVKYFSSRFFLYVPKNDVTTGLRNRRRTQSSWADVAPVSS